MTVSASAASTPDLPKPVSTTKATWTPQVAVVYGDGNNHEVWDYEALSNGVVAACGKFVQVRPRNTSAWTIVGGVFAFNSTGARIGQLTSFRPSVKTVSSSGVVSEGTVNKCELGYDGTSLVIAGSFNRVNDVAVSNVAKINTSTGAVESFPVATNGVVSDLVKANGKYWLFGKFWTVNGRSSAGIATVNPDGSFSTYYKSKLSGQISTQAGPTSAFRAAFTADETLMVAIVNSSTIDGQPRRHLAVWNLGGTNATLRNWQLDKTLTTNNTTCQRFAVGRGLSIVPGTYDAILGSTGGANNGICDQTMRFALNGTGTVSAKWSNYTCGDTIHSVAATTGATYSQGHMKCTETLVGGARDYADRNGIFALSTGTGSLITSWRSDQARCVGGKSLYVLNKTGFPQGLLSGSDCDYGIIFRPL